METVRIKFDRKANVTVSVEGVAGNGCQKLTEKLQNALGNTVSETPTEEMYQQAEAQEVSAGY